MIHEVPGLSHCETLDGLTFWVTLDGVVGITFRTDVLDLEAHAPTEAYERIFPLIKDLSSEVRLRIHAKTVKRWETEFVHPRQTAVSEIGFVHHQCLWSFELKEPLGIQALMRVFLEKMSGRHRGATTAELKARMERLEQLIPITLMKSAGLSPQALEGDEIKDYFSTEDQPICLHPVGLELGSEIVGLIRVWKPAERSEDSALPMPDVFADLRFDLPMPYEFIVTLQAKSLSWSEFYLGRRIQSLRGLMDLIGRKKYSVAEGARERLVAHQDSLLHVEYQLLLRDSSESVLRKKLTGMGAGLGVIGDAMIETIGRAPSFIATLPGSTPHLPMIYFASELIAVLPIYARGEALHAPKASHRSLALHRRDGSLNLFDAFDRRYINKNIVVIGLSGRGKSVFVNNVKEALRHDPLIHTVLIDVASSYQKTCDARGGQSINFKINDCGMNTFEILREMPHQEEVCVVLSAFLGSLILERDEPSLSKEMQAEIDHHVLRYSESRPKAPTLTDFVAQLEGFPRHGLLKRWAKSGIYQKVFEPNIRLDWNQSFTYFDFPDVNQAASGDFAAGAMAGVIAWTNFKPLMCKGVSLDLTCDEATFYIKTHGDLFRFASANYRKLGHSCTFISQKASDLILPGPNGGDNGLLANAETKLLLSIDGDPEQYAHWLGLTSSDMLKLGSLQHQQGALHEALLKDSLGSRIVHVKQTSEEFWRTTTNPEHRQAIEAVRTGVRGLTGYALSSEEAARCLSILEPR